MKNNSARTLFGATIFLAWCTVIIVIFFYYPGSVNHMQGAYLHGIVFLLEKLAHFPFTAVFFNALFSFFGMVFYGVSCISLGIRFSSIFFKVKTDNENDSHLQLGKQLPTYFLIGNIIFSLVLLVVASLALLTPLVSLMVLAIGFLSGITRIRKPLLPRIMLANLHGKVVFFLSVALLVATLFQSSARISYDASAIYFSNAKLTALEHRAQYFSENTFVASAFHSIIQFSAISQIFGDQSARMITWLFGLINVAIMLALAENIGASKITHLLALAMILTSTAFVDLMGDGKVDLISSAYALGVIYWLTKIDYPKKQDFTRYILSGCFIGFACIVRPYNTFLLGVFVIVHYVQQLVGGKILIQNTNRQLAWMALGASGFAIYHLAINKILLGSPFAFWSNFTGINPVNGPWDFKPETIWIERLLYPVIVTFKNSPSSLGSITPLLLVFLPALAIKDIRKQVSISSPLLQLTVSALITLYAWIMLFFAIAEIRYVMFLWFILFIPIAEIAVSIFRTELVLIREATKGIVILLLVFILVRTIYISIVKYAPLDTEGNPQCIDDILCDQYSAINQIADKNERVLTLSAFRYYLRTDLFACSTTAEEYDILRALSYNNTEEFWREAHRLGFSYIAFEEDYFTRHLVFSEAPFSDIPDWVELSPIITTSQSLKITAYKFNAVNPPIKSEIVCNRDLSEDWRLQSQRP